MLDRMNIIKALNALTDKCSTSSA